nr:RES family NAD+ phosphorylase [Aliiroseovarius sp. S1339]
MTGRFWRAAFLGQEDRLLSPARATNGRWHHSSQPALYLSDAPEGCKVAVKACLQPNDTPRGIFPLDVADARIIDLRDPSTRAAVGTSLNEMHVFWADLNAHGIHPPTWGVSDQVRDKGFDGLLTPSRGRTDLTHLTLFRWNDANAPTVPPAGNPEIWNPQTIT